MNRLVTLVAGCFLLLVSGCAMPGLYPNSRLEELAQGVRETYFDPALHDELAAITLRLFDEDTDYEGFYNPFDNSIGLKRGMPESRYLLEVLAHEYGHAVYMRGLVSAADEWSDTMHRLDKDKIELCGFELDHFYFLYQANESFARLTGMIVHKNGKGLPSYVWKHYQGVLHPDFIARSQMYPERDPLSRYAFLDIEILGVRSSVVGTPQQLATALKEGLWVDKIERPLDYSLCPYQDAPFLETVYELVPPLERRIFENLRPEPASSAALAARLALFVHPRTIQNHRRANRMIDVPPATSVTIRSRDNGEILVDTARQGIDVKPGPSGFWLYLPTPIAGVIIEENEKGNLLVESQYR